MVFHPIHIHLYLYSSCEAINIMVFKSQLYWAVFVRSLQVPRPCSDAGKVLDLSWLFDPKFLHNFRPGEMDGVAPGSGQVEAVLESVWKRSICGDDQGETSGVKNELAYEVIFYNGVIADYGGKFWLRKRKYEKWLHYTTEVLNKQNTTLEILLSQWYTLAELFTHLRRSYQAVLFICHP